MSNTLNNLTLQEHKNNYFNMKSVMNILERKILIDIFNANPNNYNLSYHRYRDLQHFLHKKIYIDEINNYFTKNNISIEHFNLIIFFKRFDNSIVFNYKDFKTEEEWINILKERAINILDNEIIDNDYKIILEIMLLLKKYSIFYTSKFLFI